VLSTLLFLIMSMALIGNALVIVAIRSNHRLREQTSNIFIINLCVADLCSAIVVMGTVFYAILSDTHEINTIWCNIVCAANYCFIIVSMMTLAGISVERLIAIKTAMRYDVLVTRARVKLACAYVWLQGVIFAASPVGLGWIHYDYWEVVCAIDWQKESAVYYVYVAFCVNFALPGLIMLFCYVAIIKEARRLKRVIPSELIPTSTQLRENQHQALKSITSLVVVVGLFFLCMTPFCLTKLLKVTVKDVHYIHDHTNLMASYFGYLSSMINPFVYGIFRREFRSAFRETI
ncbi:hypothetical protein CAPTEDRAFT_54000, partial [Capitella teleta]